MKTLYQFGKDATLRLITDYLGLLKETRSLADVRPEHFETESWRSLLLDGKGLRPDQVPHDAAGAHRLYEARRAVDHDIQSAVAGSLYVEMRAHALALAKRAAEVSDGFTLLAATELQAEPELLPVFMHAAGVFSMSTLRKEVGTTADTGMSAKSSVRVAGFLGPRLHGDGT